MKKILYSSYIEGTEVNLIDINAILTKKNDIESSKIENLPANDISMWFICYSNKLNLLVINKILSLLKCIYSNMQLIVLKNENILLYNSLETIFNKKFYNFIGINNEINKKICFNNKINLTYFDIKTNILKTEKNIAVPINNSILKVKSELLPLYDDNNILKDISSLKNYVIILMGPQKVGKTTLAHKLNGKVLTYKRGIISHKMIRDNINTFFDTSFNDDNLIIDCQNSTIEERKFYIDTCKYIRNMKAICINFNYSKESMIYLNSLRNYNSLKERFNIGITKYYKNVEYPTLNEGFTQIYQINTLYYNVLIDKIF